MQQQHSHNNIIRSSIMTNFINASSPTPSSVVNSSIKTTKSKIKTKAKAKSNLPPRPYTEYTIFFRIERSYQIQISSGIIGDEVC